MRWAMILSEHIDTSSSHYGSPRVSVHQLDAIASTDEEHEQAPVANIALVICFDDPKEPIKTLVHVDGFSIEDR